jgi:anti-sigma factor RsiW
MIGCSGWRALIWVRDEGDLEPDGAAELAAHVATCVACRDEEARIARIRGALAAGGPDEEPPPASEVLDRVMARVGAGSPVPDHAVLTPQDVAAMLRVPVEEVFARLDELPCFEFAGRVRFRRRALEEWMERQEERWRQQALAGAVRPRVGPSRVS